MRSGSYRNSDSHHGSYNSNKEFRYFMGSILFGLVGFWYGRITTTTTMTLEKKHFGNGKGVAAVANQKTTDAGVAIADSSTGTLFHGQVIRKYTGPRIDDWPAKIAAAAKNKKKKMTETISCDKWSVVTTIFQPTEAVRRVASLPAQDWCTVIVADTKTPADYFQQAGFQKHRDEQRIHYLSIEDQEKWASRNGTAIGDFVQAIPYRHFARKNIGYLYAIQHGAKFIFDFDDDNILNDDQEYNDSNDNNNTNQNGNNKNKVVALPITNETHIPEARIPLLARRVFNHHPLMGATAEGPSWARGFPLQHILDEATQGNAGEPVETIKTGTAIKDFSMDRVAVLQFCANVNPDIDALHRLTKPLPMHFASSTKPLLVPQRTFAPYNAQATVHTAAAFFATLLPATVPGRVSDIWRGYFAQRLFHDLDLSLVFMPPAVWQDRNEHSYLADMKAELDLYFKTDKLLEFLDHWEPTLTSTIPARMEELWIALYEREYIEADDIHLLQLWLQALLKCGYEFPVISHGRERITNVMLMGQFNFAQSNQEVVFWVQKWKQAFQHVQVRGPFSEDQIKALRHAGVETHGSTYPNPPGYFSPMSNLAKALEEQAAIPGMKGVFYIHDDAFVSMPLLWSNTTWSGIPFDSILVSKLMGNPSMFSDVSDNGNPELAAFHVYGDTGDFVLQNGTHLSDVHDVLHSMSKWMHWPKCIQSMLDVARDPRSMSFREHDGSLIVSHNGQSDFLYVPTEYAVPFKQAAELMVSHHVFVECGMPAIIQMLRRVRPDLKVDGFFLCSIMGSPGYRGTIDMVNYCLTKKYGIIHPFKISVQGFEVWSDMFDQVTFS